MQKQRDSKRKSESAEVDPAVMEALLAEPKVAAQTAGMNEETLAWFKELLVSQGIYARYVKERKQNET